MSYKFPSLIHPSAYISRFCLIGYGCVILNNVDVQNWAGVILNPGVEIHYDSIIIDYAYIDDDIIIEDGIIIE